MNTNEASLGQSTVQTYSTTEKSGFERAVFALECTARWLDNGSDPAQAAEEIRLVIAQIKGCIARCDVRQADARQPAAIDKQAEAAWAVYWGIGEMRKNSVHFERETAEKVAAQIKSNTEIRPLYAAPLDTAASKPAGKSRGYTAQLEARVAELEAQARAASTSANVAQQAQTRRALTYEDRQAAVEAWQERIIASGRNVSSRETACFEDGFEAARADSANVAQGAEAVCQTCKGHGMIGGPSYYAPDEGGEPCPDCAPPAQTALTDDARDAARYRWIRDGEKDVFCVIGSNGPWGECGHQEIYDERLDDRIDAALTAAQSASGDKS